MLDFLYHRMIYTFKSFEKFNGMIISDVNVGFFMSFGFFSYNDLILLLETTFNVSLSEELVSMVISN